jgi:hypothetical protein
MTLQHMAFFSSIHKLSDGYVGGGSSGRDEEGEEHDLAPLLSFTEVHTAYRTV